MASVFRYDMMTSVCVTTPLHEPQLSQCSRSNKTTSVAKGGLGGTGHWPVLAGDPPDSRARSKVRDRRTFRAQDSAASCRRGRPSWPCHPEQRHPVWQVHGFKARTAVRGILTLNPSPQRRGKPVIPPKQSSGSLAAISTGADALDFLTLSPHDSIRKRF